MIKQWLYVQGRNGNKVLKQVLLPNVEDPEKSEDLSVMLGALLHNDPELESDYKSIIVKRTKTEIDKSITKHLARHAILPDTIWVKDDGSWLYDKSKEN